MKRGFLAIGLGMVLLSGCAFSSGEISVSETVQTSKVVKGDYTPQLLSKIKGQREVIYNSLALTQEQLKKVDELEAKRYNDLEPKLRKLCCAKGKLKNLNENSSSTDKEIKAAQKELNKVRKDIKKTSKKYDSQLKKILTHDQWAKYLIIRKLKQKDLSKLNESNKSVSPYKKSDLRPFGVPVSQAEYAEQLKKERCIFSRNKKD